MLHCSHSEVQGEVGSPLLGGIPSPVDIIIIDGLVFLVDFGVLAVSDLITFANNLRIKFWLTLGFAPLVLSPGLSFEVPAVSGSSSSSPVVV